MKHILKSAFNDLSDQLRIDPSKNIRKSFLDRQDALSNTTFKLMEKIETGKKTLNDFEFKSIPKMKIYYFGSKAATGHTSAQARQASQDGSVDPGLPKKPMTVFMPR